MPHTELAGARVEVIPGDEAAVTLTVRNDTDIVEAYDFEVIGPCAPWTTVEPTRLSLYPGTSGEVTVFLRPPRASTVRAGEVPLAVRVLPAEQPELVSVPEMTVVIAPFTQLRASLAPQRRRAWRTGRYQVELHNQGNTPLAVPLSATDPAEDLRFRFGTERPLLEPGERTEAWLRARASKLIWFGKPDSNPFHVTAGVGEPMPTHRPQAEELDGELVQLPLLPRWLLALLGILLALLLLLLMLRPAFESTAKEAAEEQVEDMVKGGQIAAPPPPGGEQQQQPKGQGQQQPGQQQPGQSVPGVGQGGPQASYTIEANTRPGETRATPSEPIPDKKVFYITDLVLANYQGDEGVMTIQFHDRTITTIALETFRNQDYHWVTPIEIPSGARIVANVRCTRPGTPPSGPPAGRCMELLNISGVMRDVP